MSYSISYGRWKYRTEDYRKRYTNERKLYRTKNMYNGWS